MRILLVAATTFEIAPCLAYLEGHFFWESKEALFQLNDIQVQTMVTGVGPVATAWHLARTLATARPDWVLNAGVAGAYDPALNLGDVVQITREQFADIGVEEADGTFTSFFELGLADPNEPPFLQGVLHNPAAESMPYLPAVGGLTVSRVHGTADSIAAIRAKYPEGQVETMESAAVFYGCLQEELPFAVIRGISNYVEPRNRDAWQLAKAIDQLNGVVREILGGLVSA